MTNSKRSVEVAQSAQQHITRRVFSVVMIAFVVIGFMVVFAMRQNAYDGLSNRHDILLSNLSQSLSDNLQDIAGENLKFSATESMRQFALAADGGRSVSISRRNALLDQLLNVFDQNPDAYAAIRYISSDGIVRNEIISQLGNISITSNTSEVSFAEDPVFVRALAGDDNTLYMGDMSLVQEDSEALLEPLPIFRMAAPVRFRSTDATALGVIEFDLLADQIVGNILSAAQSRTYGEDDRRYILEDSQGNLIADSSLGSLAELFEMSEIEEFDQSAPVGTRTNRPLDLTDMLNANPADFSVVDQGRTVVSAQTFSPTINGFNFPWRLVIVDDSGVVFANNYNVALLIFVLCVGAGLGVSFIVASALGRILAPLDYATRIAQDVAEERIPNITASELSGEVGGSLLTSITQVSNRLQNLNKSMESQRQRLTRNLEIAARVSRETAMLDDIDSLINRVINLICDEYGFYHAQVFLIDDIKLYAVLLYSHGEAGEKLLAQKHKIQTGSKSVIGQVIARGKSVVVNDTNLQSDLHAFNPILSFTRSEMALPLKIGDEVLGALDIQSANPNAFQEEEIQAFQLLTDQVAIAIYNGRLLLQSRDRVDQIDRLNRQLIRTSWEDTEQKLGLERVYNYNLRELKEGENTEPRSEGEALAMPIRIRGEIVGSMDVTLPDGESLSEGDAAILQAVSERVALALENARLFQETQLSLQETSVLYDLSRTINEAENLDGVIQAIIETVMQGATGGQVLEFDDHAYGASSEWLTVTADWSAQPRDWQQASLLGLRLYVPDYKFLESVTNDKIVIINNIEADPRVDESLKIIFASLKAESAVLIPLNMRGLWRATILIEFPEVRRFNDRDVRVFNALIDQAGAAVDNRLLLIQTEATLELQERLYAASRAINAAETIPDLISPLVSTASDFTLNFAISLLDGQLDEYDWPSRERVVARTENTQVMEVNELYPLRINFESPLHAREPEFVTDWEIDQPPTSLIMERLRSEGQRYSAIFPLYSDNHPVALLYVTHPEIYEMSKEDQEFYIAVTGQISTVLQKRRLLEQTERALQESRLLYDASRAITASQDVSAMYAVAVNYLADANGDLNRAAVLLTVPEANPRAPYLEYAYAWSRSSGESTRGLQVDRDTVPYARLALEADGVVNFPQVMVDLAEDRHFAMLAEAGISSMVIVPLQFRQQWFGVLVCESLQPEAFDERFERFAQSIGDQIAITIENRRLFASAETERELLSSILETMPSGVLVLDAETFVPVQVNAQVSTLLGREINMDVPFTADRYQLHHTGTSMLYDDVELPIYATLNAGQPDYGLVDDIVVMRGDNEDDQVDLLMNAAPIRDAQGNILNIVAVIEDISSLRGLENALQDNLRETIALYQATRLLAESEEIEDVLDTLIEQLIGIEAGNIAIILQDEQTGERRIARTLSQAPETFELPFSMLDDREDLFIDDVRAFAALDEATRLDLLEAGIEALAALPLTGRARQLPTGWVVVTYHEPHSFTSEEERFLTTVSDSAATVLDNRNLFVSTQNALHEASILYQASRALTNVNNHQDILNAVVDHLIDDHITQVFMVLLVTSTWDHPNASADVVASWSMDESYIDLAGITLSPDQFPAWAQLSSPKLVTIGDILETDQLDAMEKAGIDSLGVRAVVIMPLRVGNRVIGSIWLGSPEPVHFMERDQRIYQSFAEQTSLTLQASRLLEQTERRARQLATSAEVSQIASSILDLNELLPQMVDLIRDAFDYDHAQVFLMDRDDRYAVLQASTGEAGEQLLAVHHKLEKGSNSVIGSVTELGEPVIALDTGMANVTHKPNPYLPHTRSEMALPLVIKGKVVGALDVQSNQPNAFGDEDVNVLTTLAAQISVAIDNARLFEQAEHRANDMSLLFTITTAAASAETLASALQNVADDLLDSLGALSIGIYLPTTYIDDLTEESFTMLNAAAIAGVNQPLSEFTDIRVGDPQNTVGISSANFRSMIINKIEDEPLYLPLAAQAQSAIVIPLTSSAHLIGVITLENEVPFAFDHESLTLLQTMGGSLSAIIQNAQLLEQVQTTNDQLRELDRVKSEFLASMSHELRTPLNSIIGFSRVILKGIDGPLTEMQEQDLTTIYSSGQHLLGLINDILDQAKIAAGKMDIKPDYFDVKPVVEGVRSIGIGLVKDKRINIKVDVESGLPQVYGDEFRTRQILINLISNAAKFTQEGMITLSVYRYRPSPGAAHMIRIDVTDTGIGIAEKDMPLLFEAFRQVDSSLTRTAGGTGLGLPISKSLVEMQGGEMLFESVVNVGSTFSITIPLEPLSEEDGKKKTGSLETVELEAAEAAAKKNPSGEDFEPAGDDTLRLTTSDLQTAIEKGNPRKSTKTMPSVLTTKRQVLLIEDNADRVDQYRRTLQRDGFDVFTASIPLEAEAMASGLRPKIIVMDVNFTNGVGWNILQKLKDRDDTFDIPVIVVTLSNESERAYQMGAHTFLQHPIMPEQLMEAVKEAEHESNTERILIIDDQPDSTRLLTQLLDTYGQYRVFSAHNGVEGVSLVARRRPDLVILDLRMPEMDGFAVLQELRSNPETANIPVLVVTGDTLNASERDLLVDVGLMYKTDISLDDYRRFIEDVAMHLSRNGD